MNEWWNGAHGVRFELHVPHRPETWGLGAKQGAPKPALKVYQEAVRWRWRQVFGTKRLTGPIWLSCSFWIKNPRQDVTNLVKAIEDALKGFAYDDDCYVYGQTNAKIPCAKDEEPRALIVVQPYHGPCFDSHMSSGGPKPPRRARPPRDVPGGPVSSRSKRARVGV